MPEIEERVSELENMMKELIYIFTQGQIQHQEYRKSHEKFEKEMAAIKKDIALTLQKQGTLVEDMIAPNVKEIAEQKFGFVPPFLFMVRHKKQKPSDLSYIREFDVIAVYNERVIIVESKSNPKTEYIKEFIDFLKSGELLEYYPEFTGKKIIPILASLFIPEEVIKFLTKNRIYAMVLKGDIMDIVNDIS
mgnify:FL=1